MPMVWPASVFVRFMPSVVATSNRPATPRVEFTRKRAIVVAARLGSPWKTSLMAVTGSPRLSSRLRTLFCAGSGTPSRYITASGRTAIISTVRLIAKTNRLGVSIGSQTSAAPVSPDAQPPTRAAATAAAKTERRTPAVIDLDTLSIINAKPGPPQALGNAGPKTRQQCCTRRLHFEVHREVHRKEPPPCCSAAMDFTRQKFLANIK